MVHTDEKKNRIDIVIDEFGWDSDICNLFTYIKNMDSEDEEKPKNKGKKSLPEI